MDLFILPIHRADVERHIVLPALAAAEITELCLEDRHHASLTVTPYEALRNRDTHLAVLAHEVALVVEPELRQIKRAAVFLGATHANEDIIITGCLTDFYHGTARAFDCIEIELVIEARHIVECAA